MRSTMLHRRDDKPYLLVRTAIQSLATNTRRIDKSQSQNSSLRSESFILFTNKRSFCTPFKIRFSILQTCTLSYVCYPENIFLFL